MSYQEWKNTGTTRYLHFWYSHLWPTLKHATFWMAVSAIVLVVATSVNLYVSSQSQIIADLEKENARLRIKSTGLLEETLYKIDTLVISSSAGGRYEFEPRLIRLQGGRVNFYFHKFNDSLAPLLAGLKHTDRERGIAGTFMPGGTTPPVGEPLNRVAFLDIILERDRDRYHFQAGGRQFYLFYGSFPGDPSRAICRVVALDPIYRPSLGHPSP